MIQVFYTLILFLILFLLYKKIEYFDNHLEEEEEDINYESDYKKLFDKQSKIDKKLFDRIYNFKNKEKINSINQFRKKFYLDSMINLDSKKTNYYNLMNNTRVIKKYSKPYGNVELDKKDIIKVIDDLKLQYKYIQS